MNRILKKRQLTDSVYEMEIENPLISESALPGQFVIVRTGEMGERIPLTIADYDLSKGTITIVFQVVGASTLRLSLLSEGELISDVSGPLGNPSEFVSDSSYSDKSYVFIAGGVGIAPIYMQVKWLSEHGVRPEVLIGVRNQSLLFYLDKFENISDVHIVSDDGSIGLKGNVVDLLEKRLNEGASFDTAIAIGPLRMMKAVSLYSKEKNLPVIVSLNPLMIDGSGMCGACRVEVDGKTKFACVDGPEFDGSKVDFDLLIRRQNLYKTEEGRRYLLLKEGTESCKKEGNR